MFPLGWLKSVIGVGYENGIRLCMYYLLECIMLVGVL